MTVQIDCGVDRVYNPSTGKCVKKTGKVGKDLLKQGKGRRYAECGGVVVKDAKGVPYCKKPSASKPKKAKSEAKPKARASSNRELRLAQQNADTALRKLKMIRDTLRMRDRRIVELQDEVIRCEREKQRQPTPASRLSQQDINQLLRMAGGKAQTQQQRR
jgi:hypothetical protein